ncbi:MAG: NADH:flavin oxidoreductase/NADH oxidase [Thermaerobacter sp.]|nr:NADH:flavin oxidoreductase/NADH oxidase [Thermaerobacter sp.]
MPHLFDPFVLKGLSLKNRIMMSPMCQYSVWQEDGIPNDWHVVHYVSRAVGGTGLIMMEMTDVVPDGRISVHDLGIWDDRHIPAFRRIVDQVHAQGARIGVQIAHAGRKSESPSLQPEAPSAIAFSPRYRTPRALSIDDIRRLVEAFYQGARRAVEAGMDVVELHGAHGYLIHQFMSPLSNRRVDQYGDYARFPVEVIESVRAALPATMPLLMRVSAVEHTADGYSFEDLARMAERFRDAGVDMFDVSSGGNAPVTPESYPGYQVGYAAELRRRLEVPVASVGRLESPQLAELVVRQEQADLVAIGRGILRDPYWANSAAEVLGQRVQVPQEYWRAFPSTFARPES